MKWIAFLKWILCYFEIWWVSKFWGVTFLMVPPKHGFAHSCKQWWIPHCYEQQWISLSSNFSMYVLAFICTSFEIKPFFWWNCQRQKIYSCKIYNDGIYYGVNTIFRKDADTLMLDLSVEEGHTNNSYHLLSNGWKSIMLPLHCIMCPCVFTTKNISQKVATSRIDG